MNVQAAYLHILGDVVNSVGVIIASIIIWLTDGRMWYMDPICTYIFSVIVFYTTRITFFHCLRMLMEGTPPEVSYDGLKKSVSRVPGVLDVHCLHVWSISENKNACSMHVRVKPDTDPLKEINVIIREKFGIFHSAV